MKKSLLSVAVACCLFLFASCSQSPAEKKIALLKEATEKIKVIETEEEFNNINDEYETKLEEFEEKYKDVEFTEEEKEQIKEAEKVLLEETFKKIFQQ